MAENKNNPESTGSTHSSAQQLMRNIGDLFDLHQGDTYTIKGGAEDDGTPVFGEQLLLYSTTPEGERIRLLLSRDPVPGSPNSAIKIEYKDLEGESRAAGYNVFCRYVVILLNGNFEETVGYWDVQKNKKVYTSRLLNDVEVNTLNGLLVTSEVASADEINRFIGIDVKTADLEYAYLLSEDDQPNKPPSGIRKFANRIIKLTGL